MTGQVAATTRPESSVQCQPPAEPLTWEPGWVWATTSLASRKVWTILDLVTPTMRHVISLLESMRPSVNSSPSFSGGK